MCSVLYFKSIYTDGLKKAELNRCGIANGNHGYMIFNDDNDFILECLSGYHMDNVSDEKFYPLLMELHEKYGENHSNIFLSVWAYYDDEGNMFLTMWADMKDINNEYGPDMIYYCLSYMDDDYTENSSLSLKEPFADNWYVYSYKGYSG